LKCLIFLFNSFIENDFYIDLKHCLDTNRMIMIDYTNYIQTEDEEILINHIKQVTNRNFFLFDYFFDLISRVPIQ
jgi:hypothetical protein